MVRNDYVTTPNLCTHCWCIRDTHYVLTGGAEGRHLKCCNCGLQQLDTAAEEEARQKATDDLIRTYLTEFAKWLGQECHEGGYEVMVPRFLEAADRGDLASQAPDGP